MSLVLNERVKELSDKIPSDCASSVGDFANEISNGISSISSSMPSAPSVRGWKDVVCVRTVNIMSTVNTIMESKKSEAASLSAAAGSVAGLKSSADAYVAAYMSYQGSIYYQDEPPSNCEDEDAWRSEKARVEANVSQLEEAAVSAEAAVKAAFSGATAAAGGLTGGYESVELTGSELTAFCQKNLLDGSKVSVKKAVVDINGTNFDIYYVYDNRLQDFDDKAFDVYVNESIQNLAKIDPGVLKATGDTDILFEQTYTIDKGGAGAGGAQAWFRSDVNAISSWFPNMIEYDFGVAAIIHEFGHAVDSQIGYNEFGTHEILPSREVDLETWKKLARAEADKFKSCGIPFLSPAYGKNFYLSKGGRYVSEFLAEAFYTYYYSEETRELLKAQCPQTYAQIEKTIKRVQNA